MQSLIAGLQRKFNGKLLVKVFSAVFDVLLYDSSNKIYLSEHMCGLYVQMSSILLVVLVSGYLFNLFYFSAFSTIIIPLYAHSSIHNWLLLEFVSDKSISIEDTTMWTTTDKTFEGWICPLVYALISYCDDLILRLSIFLEKDLSFNLLVSKSNFCWVIYLVADFHVYFRLCQDIVLVKSEVSELLFSTIIVNIAGRKDSEVDLCKIISFKVIISCHSHNHLIVWIICFMTWCMGKLHLV